MRAPAHGRPCARAGAARPAVRGLARAIRARSAFASATGDDRPELSPAAYLRGGLLRLTCGLPCFGLSGSAGEADGEPAQSDVDHVTEGDAARCVQPRSGHPSPTHASEVAYPVATLSIRDARVAARDREIVEADRLLLAAAERRARLRHGERRCRRAEREEERISDATAHRSRHVDGLFGRGWKKCRRREKRIRFGLIECDRRFRLGLIGEDRSVPVRLIGGERSFRFRFSDLDWSFRHGLKGCPHLSEVVFMEGSWLSGRHRFNRRRLRTRRFRTGLRRRRFRTRLRRRRFRRARRWPVRRRLSDALRRSRARLEETLELREELVHFVGTFSLARASTSIVPSTPRKRSTVSGLSPPISDRAVSRYISAAPWKMSGVRPTSSNVRAISSISATQRCALPGIAGTESPMRFA